MPKLIEKELPEKLRKPPKYAAFIPVVKEFAESGMESALVTIDDGDDATPGNLHVRLKSAITKLRLSDKVGVSLIQGETYLRKITRENGGRRHERSSWRR